MSSRDIGNIRELETRRLCNIEQPRQKPSKLLECSLLYSSTGALLVKVEPGEE